jgi:hypothetical protein
MKMELRKFYVATLYSLRIVVAIETITPQMLENTWREIEYLLDILRATKGAHIEVV